MKVPRHRNGGDFRAGPAEDPPPRSLVPPKAAPKRGQHEGSPLRSHPLHLVFPPPPLWRVEVLHPLLGAVWIPCSMFIAGSRIQSSLLISFLSFLNLIDYNESSHLLRSWLSSRYKKILHCRYSCRYTSLQKYMYIFCV